MPLLFFGFCRALVAQWARSIGRTIDDVAIGVGHLLVEKLTWWKL